MRHPTLLIAPDDWQDRIDYLHNTHDLPTSEASLLLQVELAFVLMEKLNLADEPITAVWVVLSKAPIDDIRLKKLSPTQKKARANGRQLIPYPEKFNWLNALRHYQRLPLHLRMYAITETDFDTQYIDAAKRPSHEREQQHEHLYDKWLSQQLPFRQRNTHPYATQAGSYKGKGEVQINIGNNQSQSEERDVLFNLSPGLISSQTKPAWLPTPDVRAPFQVDMTAFTDLAQRLDERETMLARRLPITPRNWQKRLSELRCHIIDSAGKLPSDPTKTFTIRGFMHLAGMVSSGKSTLASLLAAHIVKDHPDKRITLLVSDVQTAIQLANQLNEWFCDDPDTPVAVPIFGRSSLHTHMRGFYASATYLAYAQCGAFHWGERWLNSLCPLQYHINDSDLANVMQSKSFIPGTEPCQNIQLVDDLKKAEKKKPDKAKKTKKLKCTCPYLPVCPQYQLYRDLPTARVWITTPGGMSSGTLPRQLDSRPIRVGELVYEQSDVVVFDEVDTLINWFEGQPSSFTKAGLGMWGTIKPDVVEYGGDLVRPKTGPLQVFELAHTSPLLVRVPSDGNGAIDRDRVGTSFAAPKVSHLAAQLQSLLPNETTLMYRALIAQSARLTNENFRTPNLAHIRTSGYGLPDVQRATGNTENRVTLIASDIIQASELHLYSVTIPDELRSPGTDFDVLVEVTLAYKAQPRRTRRRTKSYLSTWLDFETAKLDESYDQFVRRVTREKFEDNDDDSIEELIIPNSTIPWMIHVRTNWGRIKQVKRQDSTLQKDWFIVKSYQLPSEFMIAIRGHKGWDKDPEAKAPYAITVSFESLEAGVSVYERIRIANEVEVQIQQQV